MAMSLSIGLGINAVIAAGAGGGKLYAASPESWLPFATKTLTGKDTLLVFAPHTIGSGDRKNLVFSFSARSAQAVTAGYTILEARLTNFDRNASVPITFGGSATKVVNSGDNDIQCDPILPSGFSLSSFGVGSKWHLKCMIRFASGATINWSNGRHGASGATNQQWALDSAVTTVTGSGTSSSWGWTGATPSVNADGGFNPVLLGEFAGAVAPVWFGVNDSIGTGEIGDSASGNSRRGTFCRALYGNGGSTQLAGISSGLAGMSQGSWLGYTSAHYYAKYCTHGFVQTLTNDFGSSGAGVTLSAAQLSDQNVVAVLIGQGIPSSKIVRQQLLQRVTSTDSYVTEANQTVTGAGWGSGGNVPNFNAWTTTQIGTLYAATYNAAVARGTNPVKWVVNGSANYATADGLHPSAVMYAAMESPLRAVFDSVA